MDKVGSVNEARAWYDRWFQQRGVYPNSPKVNRKLLRLLPQKPQQTLFLDIACGGGFLLKEAQKDFCCYGVDISAVALKNARNNSSATHFCCSSAESLPFKAASFDVVSCIGSLEHFTDIEQALAEAQRVSKPGAVMVILVPNQRDLLEAVGRRLGGVFQDRQLLRRDLTCEDWKGLLSRFFSVRSVTFLKRGVDLNMVRQGLKARGKKDMPLVNWLLFLLLKACELITPRRFCWSFVFVCDNV